MLREQEVHLRSGYATIPQREYNGPYDLGDSFIVELFVYDGVRVANNPMNVCVTVWYIHGEPSFESVELRFGI